MSTSPHFTASCLAAIVRKIRIRVFFFFAGDRKEKKKKTSYSLNYAVRQSGDLPLHKEKRGGKEVGLFPMKPGFGPAGTKHSHDYTTTLRQGYKWNFIHTAK